MGAISDGLLSKLRDRLEGEIERDPVPAAILAMAKTREGKPITKRDTKALEEQFPGVSFYLKIQSWGLEFEWWQRNTTDRAHLSMDERVRLQHKDLFPHYNNRGGLKVARNVAGVKRWESESWIIVENARYYSARDERNVKRAALLTPGPQATALAKCAQLIEAFALIRQELKETIEANEIDQAEYIMRDMLKELTGEDIKLW
jgi:hypothetical protein